MEGERLLVARIQSPHPLKQNRGENPPRFCLRRSMGRLYTDYDDLQVTRYTI